MPLACGRVPPANAQVSAVNCRYVRYMFERFLLWILVAIRAFQLAVEGLWEKEQRAKLRNWSLVPSHQHHREVVVKRGLR
jgi:hypothetical protein